MEELREGIYEQPVDVGLRRRMAGLDGGLKAVVAPLDLDGPALERHLALQAGRLLGRMTKERRAAAVNAALAVLEAAPDETLVEEPELLFAVARQTGPGSWAVPTRPATPLAEAALLTNARGEPNLMSELRAELASADRVDLLCAFVKWHGLRLLEGELTELRERGADLRVITTTYVGATERRALDRLVRDFGAHVKVHYEDRATRLHAKAWLFRRGSGFDTGYVGSSNLSRSALIDGLEWNVRLSATATPSLLEKFRATFDTYWADETVVRGATTRIGTASGSRLALKEAGGGGAFGRGPTASLSRCRNLDVRPYPHQVQMLEALAAEREVHGRHRNLVVAATGYWARPSLPRSTTDALREQPARSARGR